MVQRKKDTEFGGRFLRKRIQPAATSLKFKDDPNISVKKLSKSVITNRRRASSKPKNTSKQSCKSNVRNLNKLKQAEKKNMAERSTRGRDRKGNITLTAAKLPQRQEPEKVNYSYSLRNRNCRGTSRISSEIEVNQRKLEWTNLWIDSIRNCDPTSSVSRLDVHEIPPYLERLDACTCSPSVQITSPQIRRNIVHLEVSKVSHNSLQSPVTIIQQNTVSSDKKEPSTSREIAYWDYQGFLAGVRRVAELSKPNVMEGIIEMLQNDVTVDSLSQKEVLSMKTVIALVNRAIFPPTKILTYSQLIEYQESLNRTIELMSCESFCRNLAKCHKMLLLQETMWQTIGSFKGLKFSSDDIPFKFSVPSIFSKAYDSYFLLMALRALVPELRDNVRLSSMTRCSDEISGGIHILLCQQFYFSPEYRATEFTTFYMGAIALILLLNEMKSNNVIRKELNLFKKTSMFKSHHEVLEEFSWKTLILRNSWIHCKERIWCQNFVHSLLSTVHYCSPSKWVKEEDEDCLEEMTSSDILRMAHLKKFIIALTGKRVHLTDCSNYKVVNAMVTFLDNCSSAENELDIFIDRNSLNPSRITAASIVIHSRIIFKLNSRYRREHRLQSTVFAIMFLMKLRNSYAWKHPQNKTNHYDRESCVSEDRVNQHFIIDSSPCSSCSKEVLERSASCSSVCVIDITSSAGSDNSNSWNEDDICFQKKASKSLDQESFQLSDDDSISINPKCLVNNNPLQREMILSHKKMDVDLFDNQTELVDDEVTSDQLSDSVSLNHSNSGSRINSITGDSMVTVDEACSNSTHSPPPLFNMEEDHMFNESLDKFKKDRSCCSSISHSSSSPGTLSVYEITNHQAVDVSKVTPSEPDKSEQLCNLSNFDPLVKLPSFQEVFLRNISSSSTE